MQVYVYNAALLCEDCGEKMQTELGGDRNDTGDSEDYPQGPEGNGGGEADSPQHCDYCHTFLENELTSDGYEYVRGLVASGKCNVPEWIEFYGPFETSDNVTD